MKKSNIKKITLQYFPSYIGPLKVPIGAKYTNHKGEVFVRISSGWKKDKEN
jgi:hypothetical protein